MLNLSIVIVNWNTRDLLRHCLQSIYQNTKTRSFEIIVVDNASHDGSLEMVQLEFSSVILVRNDQNLGFAKGCNVGISKSKGRYILLLNTDTVVRDHAFDKMLAYMETHPEVGVVGPKLLNGDETLQTGAAGTFPSLHSAFNYFFFLARLFPNRAFSRGIFLGGDPGKPTEMDWLCSACMLFRRSALEAIHLIPEDFTCYMEDILCCERLRQQHWKVVYLPEAVVVHYAGGTSKIYLKPAAYNAWRSLTIYFHDQYGFLKTLMLQWMAVIGFCLRAIVYGLAGLLFNLPNLKANAKRSSNLLLMTLWLTWEIMTGSDWRRLK